jgi:hypothetical protein
MQEGWRWLEYLKRGTTIATAPMVSEEEDADWAEVPIEYRSPDGSGAGAYNARITVMTPWRSGQEHGLELVKHYHVTQLQAVEL